MSNVTVQSLATTSRGAGAELLSRPRLGDQAAFGDVLARVKSDQQTPEQKARKAAEELISTALIGPVFKGLRESNNAAEPFKPNAAERSFGQMLDTTLAQRMVSSAHWGLVDSVAQKLLRKAEPEGATPEKAPGAGAKALESGERSISGATE
ncbi:MAG: hypothetical protein GC200_11960 [Tepidisphaera sp.]|nr:hypothetical protein [Tepidisphaera sp.]